MVTGKLRHWVARQHAAPLVSHFEEVPVLVFKGLQTLSDKDAGHDKDEEDSFDNELLEIESKQPDECSSEIESTPVANPLHETELNDLVRDLGLLKKAAEILASRLQCKNLVDKTVELSNYRKSDQLFKTSFFEDRSSKIVYCHDIPGFLKELGALH